MVFLQAKNPYLDCLIDPSFLGEKRFFLFSFDHNNGRTNNKQYFLSVPEIKTYNALIDGKNVLDQPVRNDQRKYDTI